MGKKGRNASLPGRGGPQITARGRDDIQELNLLVRDQMQILQGIREQELAMEGVMAEIESKISLLEEIKMTNARKIVLDPNFVTKCLKSVVFAEERAKTRLLQLSKLLQVQSMVKAPLPFVSIYMQYDFISAWQICYQQNEKALQQLRLSLNVSVLDSMTGISETVHKVLGPIDSMKRNEYAGKARTFRDNQLFGEEF